MISSVAAPWRRDPIYSAQVHLTYNLGSGNWLAVDAVYYTGGRSSIDGVQGDDLQKNSRFGATYAYAIDRHHSLKLQASSGVFTRTGSDYDTVSIAWQYRWGAVLTGTIIRVPARDRRVPIALQDGTSESSNSRAPSKKIWMPMQNSRNAIPRDTPAAGLSALSRKH